MHEVGTNINVTLTPWMAINFPTIQHRNASLLFHWLAKDKTEFEKIYNFSDHPI